MKKLLSLFLGAVLLSTCIFGVTPSTVSAAEPGYGENILNNSDFETGPFNTQMNSPGYNPDFTDFSSWFRVTSGNSTINNQLIVDPLSSSNHICKVMQTLLQSAKVTAGRAYEIKFKIRSEVAYNITIEFKSLAPYTAANNGTSYSKLSDVTYLSGTKQVGAAAAAEMVLTTDYTNTSGLITLPVAASGSTWTQYSIRFTLGAYDSALTPLLQIGANNYSTSDPHSFYVDDVTLAKTLNIRNLITDSDFESYSNGTALGGSSVSSPKWLSDSGCASWFNAKVTNTKANSGTKSLSLTSRFHTAYRSVTGLKADTDYIFSFYYYLPVLTAADNVKFASSVVAPSTATLNTDGSVITPTIVTATNTAAGTGQWVKQVVTFNSGVNTAVNLYFRYNSDAGTGEASTLLLDDIMLYPLADLAPVFDVNTGSITCTYGLQDGDNISYKAVPFGGNSFLGWYSNGVRSQYKDTFKVSQYSAADYTASFVNNNVITDGGFENYASGTNMKLQSDISKWYTVTNNGGTWPTVMVDTAHSHISGNSLQLYSYGAGAYRKVDGLKTNTIYSLSLSYYLPAYTATNLAALSYLSVIPGTSTSINYTGNQSGDSITYSYYSDASYRGTGSWQSVSILFDSGTNTSIYFLLGYAGDSTVKMNIDDITLCPYRGSGVILNNDFEQYNTKQWTAADSSVGFIATPNSGAPTELGKYCGKILTTQDFKSLFSPTISFDGGCSYEVSMWMKLDSTYPTTMTLPSGESSNSYIDMGLMNDKTGESGDNSYLPANTATVKYNRYNSSNVQIDSNSDIGSGGSRIAWAANSVNNAALGNWNKFVFTFTAPSYSTASFAIRLNCKGTAYIDGFSVKKLTTSPTDEIKHTISKVGNAIRTTGSQGIRFKNRIDKNALAALYSGYHIVEYGAVAIKNAYLGDSELVLNGTYNYNGVTKKAAMGVSYRDDGTNTIDIRSDETKTTIDYSVVLVGVSSDNYLSDYAVRPYLILQNDSGVKSTVYCDTQLCSIFKVAQMAYNAKNPDQSFTESAATRANLLDFVLNRANYIELSVDNNTAPLSTSFKGISSTVYHCYTFMKDNYNRNYTDAMAATEMDRLKDSGITTVRSIFKSSFAWSGNEASGGWDWNSANMQAVYKWAKMLQDRGIDIAFNAGWQMNYITDQTANIPEVPYLLGNTATTADKYGESNGVSYTGLSTYDARIKRASLRYGEWIKQAMQAMTAHGIYNVKYLLVFTEPSVPSTKNPTGSSPAEWCTLATALHQALVKAGIRSNYKLVGPNQGSTNTGEGLLSYALGHLDPAVIDIYSTHYYPRSNAIYNDVYGSLCDGTFGSYMDVMNRYGSTKDFWCDEFYASSATGAALGADIPWSGTQTAVGLASAMNLGIESMISWSYSDQLWVNQTNTGGEFVNGYHMTGMVPSLLLSDIPKSQYYATGITSRYFGGGGGSIYSSHTVEGSGLYISSAKLADGNWTIMVVNAGANPATFRVTLGSAINTTLNRHLYDPASCNPTAAAKLAGIDASFNVTNTLTDTIPSGGVAMYTSRLD